MRSAAPGAVQHPRVMGYGFVIKIQNLFLRFLGYYGSLEVCIEFCYSSGELGQITGFFDSSAALARQNRPGCAGYPVPIGGS